MILFLALLLMQTCSCKRRSYGRALNMDLNRVPGAGAKVQIPKSMDVVYDLNSVFHWMQLRSAAG